MNHAFVPALFLKIHAIHLLYFSPLNGYVLPIACPFVMQTTFDHRDDMIL